MDCEGKKRALVWCKRDPQGSKKWNIYKNYDVYSSLKPALVKELNIFNIVYGLGFRQICSKLPIEAGCSFSIKWT